MFVELKKKCFVYLFYYNEKKDVYMLFPYNLKQFSEDYDVNKKYYIPEGFTWLELNKDVGIESFFLLASSGRLFELEDLFREYLSADRSSKREIAEKLVAKIREIRKQRQRLTTEAERPIPIGGSWRGTVRRNKRLPDFEPLAREIQAANFYSKAFTIDHQ
jgi:hypothetical protein